MTGHLQNALDAIDLANAADPTVENDTDGAVQPAALLYGQRMSAELDAIAPDASDVLKIAARGQHIERWTLPRTDYPEGRAGYLKWRRDQGRRHGERLAGILADAGYPAEEQERIGVLLRKEGIKRDTDVQALEDTACMVFMRWYFPEFAAKHPDDKVLDIVAKTARKMSEAGRALALDSFDLPDTLADAIRQA